jgi:hypothetical protein
LKEVAQRLAPTVHLHSRETAFPASVDWYLARMKGVKGQGEHTIPLAGWVAPAATRFTMDLFPGVTDLTPGPLNGTKLRQMSAGSAETEEYSVWPLEAAAGQSPSYDTFSTCPFSDYQQETFKGQPLQGGKCTAPAYCHLTQAADFYVVTYYFFYAYNGGLGPTTSWDAAPLALNCGFSAHMGDWERISAKVRINDDKTIDLVSVDYEWHGNDNEVSDSGHSFTGREIAALQPITAFSCWHSHSSHPDAGQFQTDAPVVASDYADDEGAVWQTGSNLVFIDSTGPDWVFFNGNWGASVKVNTFVASVFQADLKHGPSGPALKDSWKSFRGIPTTEVPMRS